MKTFAEADVAIKAAGETTEELGAVFHAWALEADAVDGLVEADDVFYAGGFVTSDPAANDGLFLGVRVNHGDTGLAGADVGDCDFLEHGGKEVELPVDGRGLASGWANDGDGG